MKHKHSFNAVSITHFIIILIAAIGLTLIPSCSDGHKSSRSGGGGGGGTGSGTGTGTGTGPGTINGKISNSPNKPSSWSGASSKGLDYIRSNWKNSGYPPPAGPIVSASYCGLAMLAAGDDPKSGALKDAADYVAAHITDRGGGGNDFDNWGFSIGSWFLSEMALHTGGYKSELQSGIGMLETHQLSNGGYAHGPTAAPNALGYTELVIISIWAIHAMAGAQKAGISVSKLDSACGWVEQCTSPYNGGVYYSLEATKTNVHRTGGSMSAFLYAGKSGSSKYSGFASYFKERFAEIPEGHSSAAMGYLNGALGSAAIGQDQWDKFVSNFFENIISHQNGDGSFQAFDGEGKYGPGEFDGAAGPTYRTGLYVLILNLDMGNLYTLGGS